MPTETTPATSTSGTTTALQSSPQPTAGGDAPTFQDRVQPWMLACFGAEISADRLERSDRFIEEALELVQASGYSKDRAHQLVEYVFSRDQGEINQEVGGVMVTLAAHCLAHGVDMHEAAERELARVWTKVETIRAKQASKPKGSALPIPVPDALSAERARVIAQAEQIAMDAAINEEIILRDFMGRPDLVGAWQDACNFIAAALRALGQQDTGGADHG